MWFNKNSTYTELKNIKIKEIQYWKLLWVDIEIEQLLTFFYEKAVNEATRSWREKDALKMKYLAELKYDIKKLFWEIRTYHKKLNERNNKNNIGKS